MASLPSRSSPSRAFEWVTSTGEKKIIAPPSQEEIALRAYQIFLKCGGRGQRPDQDWLEAQRELIAEAISSIARPEDPDEYYDTGESTECPAAFRPARIQHRYIAE